MSGKVPLHRLDTTGATSGDVPIFNGVDYTPGPITPGTIWVPVTTVDGSGNPTFVWDGNDELLMMEITTP